MVDCNLALMMPQNEHVQQAHAIVGHSGPTLIALITIIAACAILLILEAGVHTPIERR
jgi:hypothetical protein